MNPNCPDFRLRQHRWLVTGFATLALSLGNCSQRCVGSSCVTFGQPQPAAKVTPKMLTFGNQTQGTASAGQTVALSNTGQATLQIASIKVNGDFTQENTCGALLGTSQGCMITVAFAPTTTGTLMGQLSIADNDPAGSQVVKLIGMGVAAPAAVHEAERRIYVANFALNHVSILDRTDWRTVGNVEVGRNPAGIAVAPDGGRVYVSNFGDGTLSVIDAAKLKVVQTVRVGENPSGVGVSADGTNVWVANSGSHSVSWVDAQSGTVRGTLQTGARPRGLAVTQDGAWAYVTNSGEASVWKIAAVTGEVAAKIPVGGTPMSVVMGRRDDFLFVANADSASVSVISTASDSVVATIPVGVNPVALVASRTADSVFVVNQNFMRGPGSVTVLDSERLVATGILAAGVNPLGIMISEDGRTIYVSNCSDGSVEEVGSEMGTVLGTHDVGTSPVAIALSPEH